MMPLIVCLNVKILTLQKGCWCALLDPTDFVSRSQLLFISVEICLNKQQFCYVWSHHSSFCRHPHTINFLSVQITLPHINLFSVSVWRVSYSCRMWTTAVNRTEGEVSWTLLAVQNVDGHFSFFFYSGSQSICLCGASRSAKQKTIR